MKNVGFIGWRGMVGSVLMDRMSQENDFANLNPVFLQLHKQVKSTCFWWQGCRRPEKCIRY